MRVVNGLSCFLLVSLAACGGGGNKGVGPKVEEHSQYAIESNFDVQTEFAGDSKLGSALNTLHDMSDHPDDPGRYIVEQMISKLPWPLDSAAETALDELAPQVNAIILGTVPAVDEIKGVADGLSNAARVYEVQSFLDVGLDSKGRFTGSHEVTRVLFTFGGQSLELQGADLGTMMPTERLAIGLQDAVMTIPRHKLQLPMGTALKNVLDQVIVPVVSPGTAGFDNLLGRWFACSAISATIAETIGGGEDTVKSACMDGSSSAASKVTDKLLALDADGGLVLGGQATLTVGTDTWTGGGWSGMYLLGDGGKADLEPANNNFIMTLTSGALQ